jgi:hypothetical protein
VPAPRTRTPQDAFVRALAAATEAEQWPYVRATVRPAFETTVD